MTMLEYALWYVNHAFKVLPVKQDKTPLTEHGLKDATQTQAGVKEFWAKYPDAGIAIVTDGLIVLDFDVKNGGMESKAAMITKFGDFPATRVHRTGGGGEHWLYRSPNGSVYRNTVSLGGFKGVDVRAKGGYIVVPPSLHLSGNKYEVISKAGISSAPAWLIEMCDQKPLSAPSTAEPGQTIPESQRNATLASLAGTMRKKGMTEEAILAALVATNRTQCSPPLPDKEVETIARSIARYQPDPLDKLNEKTDIIDNLGIDVDNLDNLDNLDKTDKFDIIDKSSPGLDMDKPFKLVSRLVDNWLAAHKGEGFPLDTICRHLDITNRDLRHAVVKKLAYEVSAGKLAKSIKVNPPIYTYIDKELVMIDWVHATDEVVLPLKWPYGRGDDTRFGFDGAVQISSGDIIIIAGVSNTGKTAMALNLLAENMDAMPVTLMGNEYSGGKFRHRLSKLAWANPLKEDGTPKFELAVRHDNWADVIRPDNLNIIDWLNLDGTSHPFYEIGSIIEGIQKPLRKGIAVICIQMDAHKEFGLGGGFSQHLASLYLAIDFLPDKSLRMTVKKAKAWEIHNPNHEMYAFDLREAGTVFSRIRPIQRCSNCGGRGIMKTGGACDTCGGSGHVDKVESGTVSQSPSSWTDKY